MPSTAGSLSAHAQTSAELTATIAEKEARLLVWPMRTDGRLWLQYLPAGASEWIPFRVEKDVTTLTVKAGDKVRVMFDHADGPPPQPRNYRLELY